MKKMMLILVMIVGLFGCEYREEDEIEIGRIENYDFENDLPEFENIQQLKDYMEENSEYISDFELYGVREYIEPPKEFYYNHMQGDCDGSTIFCMYLLNTKLNLYSEFVCARSKDTQKIHAFVYIPTKNIYIETTGYYYMNQEQVDYNYNIIHSIPYAEILWIAKHHHKLVGKYSL